MTTEAPTLDKPLCPQCSRQDYLTHDGAYWWTCKACGHRATPGAIKAALRKWKQRQGLIPYDQRTGA